MGERVQGGRLAARAIAAAGVDCVFTLSGGHVMPIYEGGRHEGVRIVDGSGLSSLDRLTPAALAGVIRAGMQDPRIGKAFLESFAVAGRTGTLDTRLPGLAGLVRGKTGTTDLACSLSGVIGDRIVFSVLQNGRPVSFWSARTAQDRFVTALAGSLTRSA